MPQTEPTPNQVQGFPSIKLKGMPLRDTTEVAEVVVDLDATRPGMFTVRIMQSVAPGSEANLEAAIGDEMEIGEASSSKTLIKGEVTSIEAEFSNAGQRTIIRGMDKSHRLQRHRSYKAHLNLKDSDIASAVAGAASVPTGTIDATTTVHKYVAQVNQTDWEFLKWRAEENGMTLDFSDGALNFRKQDPGGPAAFQLSPLESLLAFRPRVSAPRASGVTSQAWDEVSKAAFTHHEPIPASDGATLRDTPTTLANKFSPADHLSALRPAEEVGDVTAYAKAIAGRYADSHLEAEGVAYGDPGMVPGKKVTIADAGSMFNGDYRISAAKHTFNAHQRYTVTMRFSGIQDKSLLALTSGNGNGGSRASKIEGVVPAIVTNIKDPETRCRVKLKFPWLDDAVEGEWTRVMQPNAGNGHGWVTVPEVGDEVLVAFENGDFRRPYVIGGLYNGQDKPTKLAYDPSSGKANLRGFVSLTGHKLVFQDDGPDKKGIHVITSDGNLEIYLNEEEKKITIDCKSGKVEIHGMDDITIKSDKNINIEATQKLSLKGQTGIDINSPQDVSVSGLNAKITANVGASLSGSANVEVKSSGIAKVQGSLVQIN